ncbi:RagB/SusD family nutrient uptake outer membrane protein [Parapedobacter sp. SGR-10]|uniref:RagB/SusD family nutrient uptake outer membrane protein n=1 Tax=Parapedobacter sp. SGR-10 TaxID=2710879 RepID=UPI0013D434CC|nr:RagB/SusD family nutrient uptake outer membrane protein [Parapedobacter sp. SGR-10]NGF55395.1 RagB/SusD family nutrient uptake outer membrane protein [Parapedobacter sp. SGR-10]
MKIYTIYTPLTALILSLLSCGEYLDTKPHSNLVVPESLDDMEQLLDNGTVFTPYPELLELQADDFYFEQPYWESMFELVSKNAYIWAKDIYGTTESHSAWSQPYSRIFYANAVLDGLQGIARTQATAARHDHIKGCALFLKAEAVYILAQLFAKVYDERTAHSDLGIPIPISADVNEQVSRPTLEYTFEFITNSLTEAEKLLSATVDYSRPSKAAANALLARVYLYMGRYENALDHSSASLQSFDDVIDLNTATVRDYKNTMLNRFLSPSNDIKNLRASTLIDTVLIRSYSLSDKRLSSFYLEQSPKKWVKKRFNNLVDLCFTGLDADEQYLIRSECYARDGQLDKALEDLNNLLKNRFTVGAYVPYSSSDRDEVLRWILEERRKELIFRGVRWSDLKRLNREGFDMKLTRMLGNDVYTLAPHDPKWVLPIPLNEVSVTKIIQNER